jgi:N6-L-threonylcarbamoyladenine synthase
MAAEIQQAIIDVLIKTTMRAAKEFSAKSIILGGGVAANLELRSAIKKECVRLNLAHLIPPPNLATDNGLMIALAGYFTYKRGDYPQNPETIEANPNLRMA